MRVQVWISNGDTYVLPGGQIATMSYGTKYYIKVSRGLFDMCQFQISDGDDGSGVDSTFVNHTGMRFFGLDNAGTPTNVVNLPWTVASLCPKSELRQRLSCGSVECTSLASLRCRLGPS